MTSLPVRLLCVGQESELLELRCAVLRRGGYHATSATVPESETILRTEHIDLVIVSAWLQEWETEQVLASAGKTPALVLTRLMLAGDLLDEVGRLLLSRAAREATP